MVWRIIDSGKMKTFSYMTNVTQTAGRVVFQVSVALWDQDNHEDAVRQAGSVDIHCLKGAYRVSPPPPPGLMLRKSTFERVEAAIRQSQGYSPNHIARSLSKGTTGIIGVLSFPIYQIRFFPHLPGA